MPVNREYKDSVFSLLFNDKTRLLELYNALHDGTPFTEEDGIEINTLRDALFMGRVNDISFLLGDMLVVLVEHQSTLNPNMPLRMLLYIGRIYEKIGDNRRMYASRKVVIPRPEFIVLYNGPEAFPERKVLKLSDLYKELAGYEQAMLELEVRVYNINKGVNPVIEERCPTPGAYAELVDRVRKNEQGGASRDEAVKEAVRYCQGKGILKEFLREHGSEVENMLLTEWNWDDALQVRWEEGWEEGREKGREEGIEKGIEKGVEEDRKWVMSLLEQGMSPEELKRIIETSPLPR